MFVLDVSPSMGQTRDVELPGDDETMPRTTTMSNLQWALQYVMYKIQEMVSLLDSFFRTRNAYEVADFLWQKDGSMWGHALWYSR
jgi:hypothetical protein